MFIRSVRDTLGWIVFKRPFGSLSHSLSSTHTHSQQSTLSLQSTHTLSCRTISHFLSSILTQKRSTFFIMFLLPTLIHYVMSLFPLLAPPLQVHDHWHIHTHSLSHTRSHSRALLCALSHTHPALPGSLSLSLKRHLHVIPVDVAAASASVRAKRSWEALKKN